jgi:hypothetical protein
MLTSRIEAVQDCVAQLTRTSEIILPRSGLIYGRLHFFRDDKPPLSTTRAQFVCYACHQLYESAVIWRSSITAQLIEHWLDQVRIVVRVPHWSIIISRPDGQNREVVRLLIFAEIPRYIRHYFVEGGVVEAVPQKYELSRDGQ